MGFPGYSVIKEIKESAFSAGNMDSVPRFGWERSPRKGNDNPLQYSCLKNPMDRETW